MPDRHSELLRQRALVLEHLAWLDREIASTNPLSAVPAVPTLPVAPSVTTPPAASMVPASDAADPAIPLLSPVSAAQTEPVPALESDGILEQYRVTPAAVHQDVRKGCFLYFAAAFVVLGIVVAILYFAISTR
jgi:hypothetical protein